VLPMFVVGGLMVLSGVLMVLLNRRVRVGGSAEAAGQTHGGSTLASSGPVR